MEQTSRRRFQATSLLAVGLAAIGIAALAVLFVFGRFPSEWWAWAFLAIAFVLLEFASVEISDQIRISSSVMVAFTAAVVLGREAAVPAVALMAAVAMLQPDDVRNRRWQQPLANLGQLVLSSSAGMLIFVLFLPESEITRQDLPLMMLGAAAGGVVYNYLNYQMVAGFVRVAHPGRSMPAWSSMLSTHATLAALAMLGALLGAAYVMVGTVISPLILMTYLVGHIGFSTYARLRQAHESTIRGFVKVVEALDPYTRGHTERVAHFCRITGAQMDLTWERMERLRWAALLHDVSKLAVPGDLASREEAPSQADREAATRHRLVVEGVLAEVEFLRPMVAITSEAIALTGDDTLWEAASLEARILAVADVFDSSTTTRSYREAITQTEAFAALRAESDRYGTDVLDAFEAAVGGRGEIYGSPDAAASARLDEQVRERAIRA
jgi:HD-GYP domain-containing protein (c-di-GMP phosphodiesterase class II)